MDTRTTTFEPVNSAAVDRRVRARLGRWPDDDEVVHLVLLDHHMVPDASHIDAWMAQARAGRGRTIRTGALFPPSVPAFVRAGFRPIDTLALYELDLRRRTPDAPRASSSPHRVRRLRPSMLHEAAAVDRRAFAAPWANDPATLADIVTATPQHRARCVRDDRDRNVVAFVISGRAGDLGYIQRLAVDPAARRRGLGRLLVEDALRWMRRRQVSRVLVNTGIDNHPARDLYRSLGFDEQPDRLQILERTLR